MIITKSLTCMPEKNNNDDNDIDQEEKDFID